MAQTGVAKSSFVSLMAVVRLFPHDASTMVNNHSLGPATLGAYSMDSGMLGVWGWLCNMEDSHSILQAAAPGSPTSRSPAWKAFPDEEIAVADEDEGEGEDQNAKGSKELWRLARKAGRRRIPILERRLVCSHVIMQIVQAKRQVPSAQRPVPRVPCAKYLF
jgi:hypothetical protein